MSRFTTFNGHCFNLPRGIFLFRLFTSTFILLLSAFQMWPAYSVSRVFYKMNYTSFSIQWFQLFIRSCFTHSSVWVIDGSKKLSQHISLKYIKSNFISYFRRPGTTRIWCNRSKMRKYIRTHIVNVVNTLYIGLYNFYHSIFRSFDVHNLSKHRNQRRHIESLLRQRRKRNIIFALAVSDGKMEKYT